MIPFVGLLSWTLLILAVTYISWTKIGHHLKIYLLILYSAILLTGVFWIFPFLKNLP